MTNEQAQKVLDELNEIKPEQLEGNAKRLFEAIMKIADERDKIKQEYDRDTHILQNQLDLANAKNIDKDKIIDLMSDEIESLHSSLIGEFGEWTTKYCQGGEETTIEEIKQYFENEVIKD